MSRCPLPKLRYIPSASRSFLSSSTFESSKLLKSHKRDDHLGLDCARELNEYTRRKGLANKVAATKQLSFRGTFNRLLDILQQRPNTSAPKLEQGSNTHENAK
jgi:hypothetical protein